MIPVAVCLGFRNWHLRHLQRCLQSLRLGTVGTVVVCDLGSDEASMPSIRRVVTETGAVLRAEIAAEWSRSRALNLAAAMAPTAAWYVFTDADMLFPPSWFTAMQRHITAGVGLDTDRLFLTRARDLDEMTTDNLPEDLWFRQGGPTIMSPEEWLWSTTTPHPTVGQGAAMVVPGPWFRAVGGFDEFYQVWGAEDNDLVLRAQWDGHPVEWLRQESGDWAWVAHQWHRRDWPTQAQFAQVHRNRAYLAERIAAKGPIVRNREERETA